jgi:hypothetical protein
MKKVLAGVVAAAAGMAAFGLPSLRRYLKIEKM